MFGRKLPAMRLRRQSEPPPYIPPPSDSRPVAPSPAEGGNLGDNRNDWLRMLRESWCRRYRRGDGFQAAISH